MSLVERRSESRFVAPAPPCSDPECVGCQDESVTPVMIQLREMPGAEIREVRAYLDSEDLCKVIAALMEVAMQRDLGDTLTRAFSTKFGPNSYVAHIPADSFPTPGSGREE